MPFFTLGVLQCIPHRDHREEKGKHHNVTLFDYIDGQAVVTNTSLVSATFPHLPVSLGVLNRDSYVQRTIGKGSQRHQRHMQYVFMRHASLRVLIYLILGQILDIHLLNYVMESEGGACDQLDEKLKALDPEKDAKKVNHIAQQYKSLYHVLNNGTNYAFVENKLGELVSRDSKYAFHSPILYLPASSTETGCDEPVD